MELKQDAMLTQASPSISPFVSYLCLRSHLCCRISLLILYMEEMMAAETRKKVFVNVPLTFERPLGLRAAKGDLTSKYFKLA